MNDPQILDTSPELALFQTRMSDLLERLPEQECPAYRATAKQLFGELEWAIHSGAPEKISAALHVLGNHLDRGAAQSAAWDELLKLGAERAKRAEAKATVELKGMDSITGRDLAIVLGRVCDLVLDECAKPGADPAVGRRILGRLDREITGGK